jgi:hypothetical protein
VGAVILTVLALVAPILALLAVAVLVVMAVRAGRFLRHHTESIRHGRRSSTSGG